MNEIKKEADIQLEKKTLVGTSESGNGNIGVRDWVAQTTGCKVGSKMLLHSTGNITNIS